MFQKAGCFRKLWTRKTTKNTENRRIQNPKTATNTSLLNNMERFLDFVLSLLWKVPTHALPNLVRTTPHCGNKWCNPVAPEAKKYLAKFHVFFSLITRNETLHRVSGTNIISQASLDPPNILFISTSGVCTIFQDTRYWVVSLLHEFHHVSKSIYRTHRFMSNQQGSTICFVGN